MTNQEERVIIALVLREDDDYAGDIISAPKGKEDEATREGLLRVTKDARESYDEPCTDEEWLEICYDEGWRGLAWYEEITTYEELVGKMYCKHTKSINFKNKILYVKLDSAALKQELSYKREEIITRLNQKLGRRIVEQLDIK